MQLLSKPQIVVLTGAGISAESGIATFRDSQGLWQRFRPEDLATPEAFAAHPDAVYEFYNARRAQLKTVEPNPAHIALSKMQGVMGDGVMIVTQNVDDLHERAGAKVLHMHGELQRALCTDCGESGVWKEDFDGDSHCQLCGKRGALRPDIVWFGEIPYHMMTIETALNHCQTFVAIGTSGTVYPAAGFVQIARAAGADTVEINIESSAGASGFDSQRIGNASEQVPAWVEETLNKHRAC